MNHIETEELTYYLDGDIAPSRGEEIDNHLKSCGACHNDFTSLSEVFQNLQNHDPALADIDLTDNIMAVLQKENIQETDTQEPSQNNVIRPARSVWFGRSLGLAAALAACFVAVLLQPGTQVDINDDSQFRMRSNPGTTPSTALTGISIYKTQDNKQPGYLGNTMRKQDSLLFAYSNAGSHQYNYMMIVGIDATGDSHWYYPAWTDPKTDPASVTIQTGKTGIELKEAIQHAVASGPYTLYAIFSDNAVHVSSFEKVLQESMAAKTWTPGLKLHIPDTDAKIQIIKTKVE